MTPRELFAAVDGYLRRIGVDPDSIQEPLTKARVKEMFEEHERQQREKAAKEAQ